MIEETGFDGRVQRYHYGPAGRLLNQQAGVQGSANPLISRRYAYDTAAGSPHKLPRPSLVCQGFAILRFIVRICRKAYITKNDFVGISRCRNFSKWAVSFCL